MTLFSAAGFAAFRRRDFALYSLAYFLATIAMQMQAVALGWQLYAMTSQPLHLGLVGLAEFLPPFLLALLAGALADRHDRRMIAMAAIGLEMLCALLLLILTLLDWLSLWPILGLAAGFGTARAFVNPPMRALMPNLVPEQELPNAVAWSSVAWQIAVIGGPALGGLIYLAGPAAVYGTMVAVLAVSILALFAIRHRDRPIASADRPRFRDAIEGIKLIFRHRIVLGAISLDLFAVLFGGAVALLPVFAKDILHVGPDGLGILRAAQGVGAVAMALVLTQWPLRRYVGRKLMIAVGLFGIFTLVFGFSESFWLSFAALVGAGAADMVSVYIRGTLVPLATPDALRGRVMAVEMVFIGASNELGAFESGLAAFLIGTVPAVLLGGGATLLIALLWFKLFPALTRVDRMEAGSLSLEAGGEGDKVARTQS